MQVVGTPTDPQAQGTRVTAAFQPILDLRDGAVVGYEALARPVDGTPPQTLFASARAEGRMTQVDRECRAEALRDSLGFVGVLEPGVLENTWTEVALGPGFGACFVARCDPSDGEWCFATSYDRELVVECALLLMARLPQRPPPAR
jgi:hypothetical protein